MTDGIPLARPVSYDKKVGLVLQGGGALGSYQAGVYEALASSEYLPDWVAGISIGAINAAIIAGNAPEHRVQRLRSFWEEITAPTMLWPPAPGPLAACQRWASAMMAITFGQPGFFTPYPPQAWFPSDKRVSYYMTSALKRTLERLVDFDRINTAKDIRLSVGAVNVETGDFAYFDSGEMRIGPEHIMASGALPPGFPPIEIDGAQYWDGGTLLQHPAAIHGGLLSTPQSRDLSGRLVPRAWPPSAHQSRSGQRAREGYSLFQPDPVHHEYLA